MKLKFFLIIAILYCSSCINISKNGTYNINSYELFTFKVIEPFGYRADEDFSRPVSFTILLPKNRVKTLHTNTQFVFFFEDSAQMIVETRLWGKDSLLTTEYEISHERAEAILVNHFSMFYDDIDSGFHSIIPLDSRIHHATIKNGNRILLINIKDVKLEGFISCANSFTEILQH